MLPLWRWHLSSLPFREWGSGWLLMLSVGYDVPGSWFRALSVPIYNLWRPRRKPVLRRCSRWSALWLLLPVSASPFLPHLRSLPMQCGLLRYLPGWNIPAFRLLSLSALYLRWSLRTPTTVYCLWGQSVFLLSWVILFMIYEFSIVSWINQSLHGLHFCFRFKPFAFYLRRSKNASACI